MSVSAARVKRDNNPALPSIAKKGTPWHWGNDQQKAFDDLKSRMCQQLVLVNLDLRKTFYLQTDALTTSVGAVLSQEVDNGKKRPVAYFSCTFSPAEANYDIYEKEFLAVIKAIQNWRAYLIWTKQPFIILTIKTSHTGRSLRNSRDEWRNGMKSCKTTTSK